MLRATPVRALASSAVSLPLSVPAIYVAGLNYRSHAAEVKLPEPKFPIFCMKPSSSLLYPQALMPTQCAVSASSPARGLFDRQYVDVASSSTPHGASSSPPDANSSSTSSSGSSASGSNSAPCDAFLGTYGNTIVVPKLMQSPPEVDYEGELAIVIGTRCRNLPEDEQVVEAHIAGFTCAMDMTGRRWQGKKGGNQWCVAKSADTFCPLGPAVVPVPLRSIPQLHLTTTLNGTVVQRVQFSDMIFSVTRMVSFLSSIATLHPGTVILTGTPAGVGYARTKKCAKTGDLVPDPHYLKHGDVLEVSIDSIGALKCGVAFE